MQNERYTPPCEPGRWRVSWICNIESVSEEWYARKNRFRTAKTAYDAKLAAGLDPQRQDIECHLMEEPAGTATSKTSYEERWEQSRVCGAPTTKPEKPQSALGEPDAQPAVALNDDAPFTSESEPGEARTSSPSSTEGAEWRFWK